MQRLGSWDNSTPMAYDHVNKTWKVTADLVPGNVKFRLNNTWTINYGAKNNDEGIMYLRQFKELIMWVKQVLMKSHLP